jgi:hypothetical protein
LRPKGERDVDKDWEIENQRYDEEREEDPTNGRANGEVEEEDLKK